MPNRTRSEFLSHWLDVVVDGLPIREWCQRDNEAGKAFCSFCKISIKYDNIGVRTFKGHASSQKHKENRAAALSQNKNSHIGNQGQPSQQKGVCDSPVVVTTPSPKNCSDNLPPLTVDVSAPVVKKYIGGPVQSSALAWRKQAAQDCFIDVYICFFCGEEFPSRAVLQGHQWTCDMKPPELQAVTPPGKAVLSRYDSPASPLPPLLCFTQEGESLALTPPKETPSQHCHRPSKDKLMSALGLLPKTKAAQVPKRRRNTECESIDLDDDIPISPTIPRTPKLLISHLSRDGSESCGTTPSPFRRRLSLFSSQQSRNEKDENAGKTEQGEKCEEEKKEEKACMARAKSLYSLDLTSPLGQFVIKHIKGDPNLYILSDVESHCLTSTPKKSAAASRLRERHVVYPVTFRGYPGKLSYLHMHQYKFNRQQKKEFMQRVNTGLDKRSRKLAKKMKPCKVRLTRLTKHDLKRWMPSQNQITVALKMLSPNEIAFWTSPKPALNANAPTVFPSGLTFSSPNVNNVLGLRTRQDVAFFNRSRLSVSNYVSEEMFAEVTANRRAVYKSLLSDSTSSESGSSEIENSHAAVSSPSMSVLRQILSTPSPYVTPPGCLHTLPDITNIKVERTVKSPSKLGVLSPVSSLSDSQIDKSNEEGLSGCNFLTKAKTNKNPSRSSNTASASGHARSDPLPNIPGSKARVVLDSKQKKPKSSRVSACSDAQTGNKSKAKTVKTSELDNRTKLEKHKGDHHQKVISKGNQAQVSISSKVKKGTDNGKGKKNNENPTESQKKVDVTKTRKPKSQRSQQTIPPLVESTASSSRKRPLENSNEVLGAKKQKLDANTLPMKGVKEQSPTNTPSKAVKQSKSQESGKISLSTKAGMNRAARALRNAVRRLSRELNNPQKEGQTGKEEKSTVLSEMTSTIKKSSELKNGLENITVNKKGCAISCDSAASTTSDNESKSSAHNSRVTGSDSSQGIGQKKLKVNGEENLMLNSLPQTHPKGESAHNKPTKLVGFIRKTRQSALINHSGASPENGDIENRDVNVPVIDTCNNNISRTLLKTLESKVHTSHSKTLPQGSASFPTELKFVSYSSPRSPQLRKSPSAANSLPMSQKGGARTNLLSAFVLEESDKKRGSSPVKMSPAKPVNDIGTKLIRDKLRPSSLRGKDKR